VNFVRRARRRVRDWRKRRTDKRPCGCDETTIKVDRQGRLAANRPARCRPAWFASAAKARRNSTTGCCVRYISLRQGSETFDPPTNGVCGVKNADSLSMRMTRPADRCCANDPEPFGQLSSAAIDLGNRKQPRLCQVSCCISTNRTIDARRIANVRRLTTEFTRLCLFKGRTGFLAAP